MSWLMNWYVFWPLNLVFGFIVGWVLPEKISKILKKRKLNKNLKKELS